MCGLAGIRHHDKAPVDVEALIRMRDAMRTRGPDGEGLWLDPEGGLGLAHRRLSIIDPSERGAQPMATANRRYHIVFNGEIYNYAALRRWCEGRGLRFSSDSDTEVLLNLYVMEGRRFVERLRGMFAFAIWDKQERTLLLARDPFGIKPMYYANDGKRLYFASQVKALIASRQIATTQDPAGVVSFFLWGYITEPHTLFHAIRALPPGSTLLARSGQPLNITQYNKPLSALRTLDGVAVTKQDLREAALDSVRHHLVADVPVGFFLSAGIDSTTILALASESRDAESLKALTLGFSEFHGSENDEVPLAHLVAQTYGCPHYVHVIPPQTFAANQSKIMDAMDQPTVDGVNTYLVSQAASQVGMKVAISGVGGDELFGGYPSFRQVPLMRNWLGWIPSRLGTPVRQVLAPMLRARTSPKYAGLLEYCNTIEGAYLLRRALFMPWELYDVLDPDIAKSGLAELSVVDMLRSLTAGIANPFRQVMALEYGVYLRNCLLRDSDWAGMAHSVEIRTPLVDASFFAAIGARQGFGGKLLGKPTFAAVPSRALPRGIVERRKTGFLIPLQQWLQSQSSTGHGERGLRAWARYIAASFRVEGVGSPVGDVPFAVERR